MDVSYLELSDCHSLLYSRFYFLHYIIFLIYLFTARERVLTHLRKHDDPQGALLLVPMKAPVPDIPTESLSDVKISTALIQEDLAKLQHQAK